MATMVLPSTTPSMSANKFRRQICPHCGSKDIHRCRARGIIERQVVRAFGFYPHWCADCDRRFYLRLISSVASAATVYSKPVGRIEFLPDGDGGEVEK